MEKRKTVLALVLVLGLVLSAGLGLLWDHHNGTGSDWTQPDSCSLVITEVCAKNETILADNDGRYRDYIELYNAGEAVDLAGFTLTDGRITSQPFGHLPLAAGEYRVIFLGDGVTGFGIGASGGDCIQLLDPSGSIAAQVTVASLEADQVYACIDGVYQVSGTPSPGFENTAEGANAFLKGSERTAPGLTISEVLIANTSALADGRGRFCDAVELHNPTDQRVYLGNCFLSDSLESRFRFRLPEAYLEPGDYLVLICDGENYTEETGLVHTNFGLAHGETLALTDPSGAYVSVIAQYVGEDTSQSLQPDGSYLSGSVSLGFANDDMGAAQFAVSRQDTASPLVISEVLLSSAGVPWEGRLQDVVELQNRSGETISTAGWYLSDGGDPYTYPLPDTQLAPGECLVAVCGPTSTGFSLSQGETVRLMSPEYLYAPAVTCLEGEPGRSIALLEDGEAAYGFAEPTLGYANTPENREAFQESQLPQDLRLSEAMSANRSYLVGAYETTADWLELYNPTDTTLNLSGYFLTDDAEVLSKYPLPDQELAPGEYCVLLLKKDSTNLPKGYAILPFPLSSQGDALYLSKDGVILDSMLLPQLDTDIAYGRGSGQAAMDPLAEPTPGAPNAKAMALSEMPAVSVPQGVYDDVDSLEITFTGPGDIYYTTDGTVPGEEAIRCSGPITITETTVFRVVCREKGKQQSEVLNLSYIINEYDTLPVVSIIADPDDLWNEYSGIYTKGPYASDESPNYGANFWRDWERPASLSLFETDGTGFTADCGIRIFGAFTRSLPKKSLACMFRDSYGQGELAYPLFGDSSLDTYESIILRTAGQDAFQGRMRDVVITSLLGEATDLAVQQYKPVIVYLDGKYWGLHYIREKLNENYVAGHCNVSPDRVTFLEDAGWNSPEYRALIDYVMEHDMTVQEHYDYVCSQIDLDSYLDFYIAQMWIANTDNGNVKYYRIDDGKWTWCMFDTDLSLLDYDLNTVKDGLSLQGLDKTDYTGKVFAARMICNPDFRDKFLTRLAWQMNTIWTEENLLNRIAEVEAMIVNDMEKECQRWNYRFDSWQEHLGLMRTFVRERNSYMLRYIQDYFGLTTEEMRACGFAV